MDKSTKKKLPRYLYTISTYNITTLGKYVCDRTHSQAKCKNDK